MLKGLLILLLLLLLLGRQTLRLRGSLNLALALVGRKVAVIGSAGALLSKSLEGRIGKVLGRWGMLLLLKGLEVLLLVEINASL